MNRTAIKAALLLNTVGDKTIRLYNNLEFEDPDHKNSYVAIINK